MRALALREPTLAQHVHVAVPDPASGGARARRPAQRRFRCCSALSANSPFWRGRDSGFASIRTPIFGMFPRAGIPRRFGHYADYVAAVEPTAALRGDPGPAVPLVGCRACVRGSGPSRSGSWTRSLASPTPLH